MQLFFGYKRGGIVNWFDCLTPLLRLYRFLKVFFVVVVVQIQILQQIQRLLECILKVRQRRHSSGCVADTLSTAQKAQRSVCITTNTIVATGVETRQLQLNKRHCSSSRHCEWGWWIQKRFFLSLLNLLWWLSSPFKTGAIFRNLFLFVYHDDLVEMTEWGNGKNMIIICFVVWHNLRSKKENFVTAVQGLQFQKACGCQFQPLLVTVDL